MGAAQCPVRKVAPKVVRATHDIPSTCQSSSSTKRHCSSPQSVPSTTASIDDPQLVENEPINANQARVVPKASGGIEVAMPKASVHPKPSSVPIRHCRWSYDALEEDQKRSLRMLSPLQAAKLIPELEPVPPLAMMSSLTCAQVQQQLDELSADLHAQGLQVLHRDFSGSWTSDTAASFSQRDLPQVVQLCASGAETTSGRSKEEPATLEHVCGDFPPGLFDCSWLQTGTSTSKSIMTMDSECITRFVGEGSLRQDLELLRGRNYQCVLVVRKIKQLGFESPDALTAHFSKQGVVEEVLVAHTRSPGRTSSQKRQGGRIRPAAMGFVVMKCAEDAKRALQHGELQDVLGVKIQVHPFCSFTKQYEDGCQTC